MSRVILCPCSCFLGHKSKVRFRAVEQERCLVSWASKDEAFCEAKSILGHQTLQLMSLEDRLVN